MTKSVLCYIDQYWAYFTTQELSKQWGDDWNDAPYEHNAGEPYLHFQDGESWSISKVAFDGPFERPCDNQLNSPWSVEQINAGAIAWLRSSRWSTNKNVIIPAGTTMERFIDLIYDGGGNVYLPFNMVELKKG